MGKKENYVQDAICDYLAIKGYLFSRINTTGVYDQKFGGFRKLPKYTLKGMSDILVFTKGQTIFIECKADTDLSDDQIKFKEDVEDEGFIYVTARGLEDVQEIGL